MKIVAGFLSSLLVVLIFVSCLTIALHQTVLSSSYLQAKLASTHVTTDISAALPSLLSKQAGSGPQSQQIAAVAQKVLTPQALQTKLNSALTQLNDFLNHGGAVPSLDVRDLAAQSKANGFELPTEIVNRSLALPADQAQKIKQIYGIGSKAYLISVVTTLVLLLVLFLVCVKAKTYKFLLSLFLLSAVLQAALFVMTKYAPSFVAPKIPPADLAFRGLQDTVEKFAWSVVGDIGQWFLIFAIAFFVLGFVTLGFATISRTRHQRSV